MHAQGFRAALALAFLVLALGLAAPLTSAQDAAAPGSAPGPQPGPQPGTPAATPGNAPPPAQPGLGPTQRPDARANASPGAGKAAAKGPAAEPVAIALADLAQGLKRETPAERADVVARNAGVADPRVVKALAKYLKDKDRTVRLAALVALGVTDHGDALRELHHQLDDERLIADEGLAIALLVAIGRHQDSSSVKLLAADAWQNPAVPVTRARLLALGNIRVRAAVVALMDLLNTDPTLPWTTSPYMADFRLALVRLTGVDRGTGKDAWREWWGEADKSLKLTAEPPKLSADMQARWDAYWALPKPAPGSPAADGAPPGG